MLARFSVQRRHFSAASPTFPRLIGRYKTTPTVLYRIQSGAKVNLREKSKQDALGRSSYDLVVHSGLVLPRPSAYFEGPNGMSLRPNGPMFQEVMRGFRGKNIYIYEIPKDLAVPEDLVILHEHSDHYSFQCDREMPLKELNAKLTLFLDAHAKRMTKEQFMQANPGFHTGQ